MNAPIVQGLPKSACDTDASRLAAVRARDPAADGRFVYAANRGHDTISVFHFEPRTAALTLLENVHVRGATPRNFNLDPTGHWLIVGGQDSHTLASFEIDQQSGRLTYNRSIVHAPSAICVLFGFE